MAALRSRGLLPREGQQLTRQGGSTFGGELDLSKGFGDVGVQIALGQLERGVAMNDREQVIEVVGDPGSQLAKGFHLLGLAQLGLELLLIRDVQQRRQQTGLLS